MTKTFQTGGVALAIALLAAAAPAVAQDRGNREARQERGGWQQRGGGEDRGWQQRGGGEDRGRPVEPPRPAPQTPAPAAVTQPQPQPQAPPQSRQNWQGRGGDRPDWQAGRPQDQAARNAGGEQHYRARGFQPQPGQAARDQAARQQYGNAQYRGQPDRGGRNDPRGYDRGQNDRGRYDRDRNDRSRIDRDRYDRDHQRDQWRGDQARGDYRRDDRARDYGRDGVRNGRDWNRGWHGDRRYDWNAYRYRNRDAFRLGGYYAPYRGYSYRRLSIGFSLQPLFFGSSYWIGDPYQYRLPPAYGPYRWVRYYDDALLVNTYTGEVVDTVYGIFW